MEKYIILYEVVWLFYETFLTKRFVKQSQEEHD